MFNNMLDGMCRCPKTKFWSIHECSKSPHDDQTRMHMLGFCQIVAYVPYVQKKIQLKKESEN